MNQKTAYVNPAKFLLPAYIRFFSEIASRLYITVVTDHPKVEIKGPVSGIVVGKIPCLRDGVIHPTEKNLLTLNITMDAVGHWFQNDEGIGFQARFNQQVVTFYIPWEAIVSVCDPSNDQLYFGIPYAESEGEVEVAAPAEPEDLKPTTSGGHLKRVK